MQYREDLYELLEVPEYSTISAIKSSYHKLAKKYHPDINPNTGHLFAEITDAYKFLSNPKNKANYDTFLEQKELTDKLKETTRRTDDLNKDINDYLKKKKKAEAEPESVHQSSYYSSKYYTNPKNESIFTILQNFSQYRFENAYFSIWDRNVFVLIAVTFLLTLALPLSLYVTFSNNKVDKQTNIHVLNSLYSLVNTKHVMILFFWIIVLACISVWKVILIILKTLYWIFRNIYIYYLLPNAIRAAHRRR